MNRTAQRAQSTVAPSRGHTVCAELCALWANFVRILSSQFVQWQADRLIRVETVRSNGSATRTRARYGAPAARCWASGGKPPSGGAPRTVPIRTAPTSDRSNSSLDELARAHRLSGFHITCVSSTGAALQPECVAVCVKAPQIGASEG